MKDEIEILQQLYNNEVNFQIRCFWHAGFSVGLGDEMNGFTWEGTFDTLLEALRALIKHASVICEECGSNKIEIVNHKPAVFICEKCGNVWKCPEMTILKESESK